VCSSTLQPPDKEKKERKKETETALKGKTALNNAGERNFCCGEPALQTGLESSDLGREGPRMRDGMSERASPKPGADVLNISSCCSLCFLWKKTEIWRN